MVSATLLGAELEGLEKLNSREPTDRLKKYMDREVGRYGNPRVGA
jgi:hypothetical protein